MKHHMPCAAYMQALSKGIAISVPLLRQPFSRTIDPTTISVISDTVEWFFPQQYFHEASPLAPVQSGHSSAALTYVIQVSICVDN